MYIIILKIRNGTNLGLKKMIKILTHFYNIKTGVLCNELQNCMKTKDDNSKYLFNVCS